MTGAASGYRWGLANKKTLLATERRLAVESGSDRQGLYGIEI
jgi:hypothetical protein